MVVLVSTNGFVVPSQREERDRALLQAGASSSSTVLTTEQSPGRQAGSTTAVTANESVNYTREHQKVLFSYILDIYKPVCKKM